MKKQYIGLITSERRAFIRVYHLWELRWCLASLAGFTVILLHGGLRGFSRLSMDMEEPVPTCLSTCLFVAPTCLPTLRNYLTEENSSERVLIP